MGVINCIVEYYKFRRDLKKLDGALTNGNYEDALKANQRIYEGTFNTYSGKKQEGKNVDLELGLLEFLSWEAETLKWENCPFIKLNTKQK